MEDSTEHVSATALTASPMYSRWPSSTTRWLSRMALERYDTTIEGKIAVAAAAVGAVRPSVTNNKIEANLSCGGFLRWCFPNGAAG